MPATRLPSFQFYPGDWLKDPALRSVSPAARGLWIDLLCLMSESEPRGYLQDANGRPLSHIQIGRMTGCPAQTVKKVIAELIAAGVVSVTGADENSGLSDQISDQKLREDSRLSLHISQSQTPGVLFSRRMVRDEQLRLKNRENGAKGGNPALLNPVNPPVNRDANRKPTPSSSSSTSLPPLPPKGGNPSRRKRDGLTPITDQQLWDSRSIMEWIRENPRIERDAGTVGCILAAAARYSNPNDFTSTVESGLEGNWRGLTPITVKEFNSIVKVRTSS